MNQPGDYFLAGCRLIGAGGTLFMKKFAEHRINIILIANMLHRKIIKRGLQMFIFAPQGLMCAAGNFDITVVTNHR